MNEERRLKVTPGVAAAAMVAVLLVGAGGTYLLTRAVPARPDRSMATSGTSASGSNGVGSATTGVPASAPGGPANESPPDVVVMLTKEAVDRAGLVVTPVSMHAAKDGLRLPGVVEANAYRQVSVTPLVGGRVVRVSAQLGDRVRRGQSVAQVYSPELAEARTKYIAAKAMLEAHDRELQRTQKLVDIGAASRQELERIHAEHAAQTAEVESARSRLELLGADPNRPSSTADASATTNVPAPIDGVVTERLANAGVNVDPTTKLFTIVDLSNVWIIADVYEGDLHYVREGDRASVTTKAYPDLSFDGRISYIDPQLDTSTRTAKVRVEVANPRGILRLGMYTDVAIATAGDRPVLSVPTSAVQNVGNRQVVYLPAAKGASRFIEREVTIGRSAGEMVEVVSGLKAGDSVVSKGSFFVRAEAERLGLRAPAAQTAKILLTEKGYAPERLSLRAGIPAHITFVRTTDRTCGTEVVFPSLNIKRALPLNEPVVIEFTPAKTGDIAFACGMNMLRGTIVVQ